MVNTSNLLFIHANRANYPELAAYRGYFASRWPVAEATAAEARAMPAIDRAICWHMMGFYPRRLPARFVIHDYRSLSVGFAPVTKDRIKALANHRPDLRIYQNESIRAALGFADGVPELLLPMGVPDDIADHRATAPGPPLGDYCYIGSMLPERRIDRMIASFLRRYGASKSLWLYGDADPKLRATFGGDRNIVFAGRMAQAELFAQLSRFRAAVCYFPNHHPHLLQTPTKLLEYAALGSRIIANEQPQSRLAAQAFGISCRWGPAEDMFAGAPERIDWADNRALDPTPMSWRSVIRGSGIDAALGTLP